MGCSILVRAKRPDKWLDKERLEQLTKTNRTEPSNLYSILAAKKIEQEVTTHETVVANQKGYPLMTR